jgi:hypothetical protein
MRKFSALLCVLFISFSILRGQAHDQNINVYRAREAITIDGILNEQDWSNVEDANELLVIHPDRLEPSLVRTSVKLLFDDKHLYIGFICIDSQPELMISEVTQRDEDIKVDDSVYVLLDVYENIDNYYYFGINLLGTLYDGTISKNSQAQETGWDGGWLAAVSRTPDGWMAEIAIDVSYFLVEPQEGLTLGIRLSRIVSRLDSIFWTEPMDPAFKISEMSGLSRIVFAAPQRWINFIPYVMPQLRGESEASIDLGMDIPLQFAKTTAGYLTINPDFMTVEPDQERFNLTRYELFLPENRDYFQEGSENYKVTHEVLFYSKRIGDLYGGLKFEGSYGDFSVAATSNQTKYNEDLDEDTSNYSIIRLKNNFGESSSVGLIAANKSVNGKNVGTAGLDTSIQFNERFSISGQAATSYGNYSTDNYTFSLFPSYDTDQFHFHIGYTQVDKNFGDNVNEVGYIWDDDRRELSAAFHIYKPIQKFGIEQLSYLSNYDVFWGSDGTLRSWDVDQGISILKQNRYEVSIKYTWEYKLFEKEFQNRRLEVFLGLDTKEWKLDNLIYNIGKNFDLDFQLGEINKMFIYGQQLSFEFAFQYLYYPGLSSQEFDKFFTIIVAKAIYDISRKIQVKAFFQNNNQINKRNFQLFLFYQLKPSLGFIQLGYQYGDPRFGVVGDASGTVFIKLLFGF